MCLLGCRCGSTMGFGKCGAVGAIRFAGLGYRGSAASSGPTMGFCRRRPPGSSFFGRPVVEAPIPACGAGGSLVYPGVVVRNLKLGDPAARPPCGGLCVRARLACDVAAGGNREGDDRVEEIVQGGLPGSSLGRIPNLVSVLLANPPRRTWNNLMGGRMPGRTTLAMIPPVPPRAIAKGSGGFASLGTTPKRPLSYTEASRRRASAPLSCRQRPGRGRTPRLFRRVRFEQPRQVRVAQVLSCSHAGRGLSRGKLQLFSRQIRVRFRRRRGHEGFFEDAVVDPGSKRKDFLSRTKGYIDIKGINPSGDNGQTPYLKRAIFLRSQILSRLGAGADDFIEIDEKVLNAFLRTPRFNHDAHSIGAIVSTSLLSPGCRSSPPCIVNNCLDLRVGHEFYEYLCSHRENPALNNRKGSREGGRWIVTGNHGLWSTPSPTSARSLWWWG